jgi:hypothetical protein
MGNEWSGGGSDGQAVVAVELVAVVETAVEAAVEAVWRHWHWQEQLWCSSGGPVEYKKIILFHLRILSVDKNNFIPFWNIILIFMGNGWSGGGGDGRMVVAVELAEQWRQWWRHRHQRRGQQEQLWQCPQWQQWLQWQQWWHWWQMHCSGKGENGGGQMMVVVDWE